MTLSRRHLLLGLGSLLGAAACRGSDSTATAGPSGTLARSGSGGPATPSPSGVDWRGDLAALTRGIEATHPNPWWRIPRADFLARASSLVDTLPDLGRRAQEVAVMELVATIDGHTSVYPTDLGWHFLAIQFHEFSDGTAVTAAPGRPELIGARLERIGGSPLADAARLLRPLAHHDNDQTIRLLLPLTYVMPEALEVKGLTPPGAAPSFTVRTRAGQVVTVTPPALDFDGYRAQVGWDPVGLPPREAPLSLTRRSERIWWTTLPQGPLYVAYNLVGPGSAAAAEPVAAVAADRDHPGVIVDIRNNPGGDNTTYAALLATVRDPRLRGRLVVIIGRPTFSAAMNFAVDIEQSTDAVFVGEPTGARPNLYGDVRPVAMPSSGLVAHVSSRYWPKAGPGDTRAALEPRTRVEWSTADFVEGRDPVLDAAVRLLR